MGLIPCGMVYGVLITAATRGSWLQGGGQMLAFGLGTIPALMAYGQVATALSATAGSLLLRLMGVAVCLAGGDRTYEDSDADGADGTTEPAVTVREEIC